jgi:hypothetical protein
MHYYNEESPISCHINGNKPIFNVIQYDHVTTEIEMVNEKSFNYACKIRIYLKILLADLRFIKTSWFKIHVIPLI